jgi:two-component SAPR family response regulator
MQSTTLSLNILYAILLQVRFKRVNALLYGHVYTVRKRFSELENLT